MSLCALCPPWFYFSCTDIPLTLSSKRFFLRLKLNYYKIQNALKRVRTKMTTTKNMFVAACLVLFGSLGVTHDVSAANDELAFKQKRFSLGVGGILVRLDTNFKFTSKPSGRSVFVDGEGTLGLPETDIIPALYGYYRFAKKHAIGFSYFRINREATSLSTPD